MVEKCAASSLQSLVGGFFRSAAGAPAMRHVRPDEVGHPEQDDQQDQRIEAMEPHLQARIGLPLLAQLHADISQGKAPRPRADESVDVELQAIHTRDAGGKRDEGANHREQTCDEYRDCSAAFEEAVGDGELAMAEEDVAAVALDQRAPAEVTDLVGKD